MENLIYADGYGRWHVLVRDTPLGLTRAVNAIMLAIGYGDAEPMTTAECRDYVNSNIVSLPLSDWDTSPAYGGAPVPPGYWVHFAEYGID